MSMQAQIRTPFPFALWADLARRDPVAFEASRRDMLENLVAGASPDRQDRLRAVQWQLDQLRHRAGNPRQACNVLTSRLWERITGREGLMARLTGAVETRVSAPVLPFPGGRLPRVEDQPATGAQSD
jgi:hypothetical protein